MSRWCRPKEMLSCLSPATWPIMVRVFSFVFDSMFLMSLAILFLGGVENEFALLPITFVLSGIIVQTILLRRFRVSQRRQLHFPLLRRKKTAVVETKVCRYCNQAISPDAKLCRFCLTEVDGNPALSAKVASQMQIQDSELQSERWRTSTNATL